jgi:hypothetical protein
VAYLNVLVQTKFDRVAYPITNQTRSAVFKNTYKTQVRKPERKRTYGAPRHVYEDNIKIDRKFHRCERVNWKNLVQDMVRCQVLATLRRNIMFHKGLGIF